MSFRIKTHGRIGADLQRVADEEIAAAQLELQSFERAGGTESIHEARKHFKKLRALVQLIRKPLGAQAMRSEQAFYRDAGREFQRVRDAQAQVVTLEKIAERFFETRRPPVMQAAGRVLAAEEHRARTKLVKEDVCAVVLESLLAARIRIAGWQLDDFSWKELRTALRRSYRQARDAWHHACAHPKPRALHDWRRRTKDLLYHICLCHSAAPEFMEEMAGELEILGEFLGDDHDFVVLRCLLERHPREIPAGEARSVLFKMFKLRRDELLDAAFDLAGRVFSESPGDFIDALDERRDDHRQRHKKARRVAKRLATHE